ncbi:N-acetylglucosaminyl-diphospho-decaprenol L-rhamnosyltransferase [Nocardioides sp. BE266]|uniref:glycosyltransferase family 2 protein n=1 Tax=Nocardioides sp. BE266 TaxID=2817725 RepID=UPI00285824C9|nr:glycosyltransferase family 2 protein [Nocardioides sp. BE266]MDR7252133.1 N-acetylglucosaminyl-diphospho-decaprenol L-rhamnosyltransferase [Nocardioides sp. BE266]
MTTPADPSSSASGFAARPDVSVVIPHYGDPAPVTALVAQLHDEPGVAEIVVVDDCSPAPLPQVSGARVVRRDTNGGFGSAVNTGVAATGCELVLILNSDVSIERGFVRRLVDAAAPWQPALAGPAVQTGGAVEHTARRFPRPRYQALERIRVLARFHRSEWWLRGIGQDLRVRAGADRTVDWIAGVCLLVPRASFDLVGGFDERFFMYAEEVDLQQRLALAGVRRVYLGSVSLDHVGGASSDPARAQTWLAESRLTYAAKWGGVGRLRALLTGVALVNVLTTAARRVAGRDVHPLRDLSTDLEEAWKPAHRAR